MGNLLKFIFLAGLFFVTFKMFGIYIIPGTGAFILIFLLFIVPLYLYCFFFNFKNFTNYLYRVFTLPYFKYYFIFLGFVLLTTIVHMLLGFYHPPFGRYIIHMKDFFTPAVIVIFMPILGLFLKVKMKSIIKMLYFIIYFVSLVAVIQYLSFILNLSFINVIIGFFTNLRAYVYNSDTGQEAMRVFSIFGEASTVGQFVFITLPFAVNIDRIKEKIFANKYIDKIIKLTILPFSLLAVIFTKSPIYLILCFGALFVLEVIKYRKLIKKHLLIALPSLIILGVTFVGIMAVVSGSMADTFLTRISTTVANMGSMEGLVTEEASLATRIIAYYWQFLAFTQNIFFGCGLNNVETFLNVINVHTMTNMPMTPENIKMVYIVQEVIGVNRSLVWSFLAEFGLVGTGLYFIFFFKNLSVAKKLKNIFTSETDYHTLENISQSFIMIFIIGFYNLNANNTTVWWLYGIILAYVYIAKYKPQEINN